MSVSPFHCAKCGTLFPEYALNAQDLTPCPACRAPVLGLVFPALLRPQGPGERAESILIDGESSCFYHPSKKAAVPCDGCGRFLCTLCDVEIGDRHLCPVCVENAPKKGKLVQLEPSRYHYDSIAFLLATMPLLLFFMCWPAMVVTAPLSFYLCIRHWNTPLSVVPRTRIRFVLALFFVLLQIGGMGLVILGLVVG
ncbi:MAG: hypothetical protein K1Y02_16890 [Candidatus Hydrogenedentes bacterium]|nr:hypothetical protein [Candidatus Hydrogenedentota bacterium]